MGTDPGALADTTDTHSPAFADLGLDARVVRALDDLGYETPSPIQAATIPALLAGRDVVGLAQTGTGKTAAFATPILSRLDLRHPGRPGQPQALVLAPTRELALQVCEAFARYAHHLGQHEGAVSVVPVYGGQAYGPQLGALRRGPHVVVGTPGRVIDHLNRGTLDVSALRFLVLDEADEMLQMGFAEDVETILATTPATKQVALFSATMPPPIRRLAGTYLRDPAEISVRGTTMTVGTTRQRYLVVGHHDKLDALTRVLEVETYDAVIVFVRTKSATEELAEKLRARGVTAAPLNGDLVQAQRERTVNQLRSGALDVLVATDVAARGLDVERITHVVNFDIPHDSESYVHRIGRTGRAGRTGEALLFVTPRERHLLTSIERMTRQPITEMGVPTAEDVNSTRVARFEADLTAQLARSEGGPDDADRAAFRRLVAEYVARHDVDPLDVAAALAMMGRDGARFLLPPDPPRPTRAERTRPERTRAERSRPERGRPERGRTAERPRAGAPSGSTSGPRVAGAKRRRAAGETPPLVAYRIEVGRRQRVQPGAIVGALANEGGLSREDFGHIDIRIDHSIVELPAALPPGTAEALSATRISGKLIGLRRADAPGGRGAPSDDRPPRKPRHRAARHP